MSVKKFVTTAGVALVLSACGPPQAPPADQNPPPAAAPAAPAAAGPSASDEQIAKLKEEQHRLERRQ